MAALVHQEARSTALLRGLEVRCERLVTRLDGCRMVWRRWGSGAPLVLLHGGYGSWSHWIHTIPSLEGERTLLVPDLPGLGDSDQVPDPLTPNRMATHVRHGLVELLGDHAPVDLAGFSFGSNVAGHMAAQLGSRVRALVLVGPGALGLPVQRIELLRSDDSMAQEERRRVLYTNLSRLMLADSARIDELALEIHDQNTRRARVKSRRFANTDILARALQRACPQRLSVVWGDRDAVALGHFAEREAFFRSLRPDVGIHMIPAAGHWVAYEAAEAFNRVLRTCLEPQG